MDLSVLILTFRKTLGTYRTGIRLGMRLPLVNLLVRDGENQDTMQATWSHLIYIRNRYGVFFVSLPLPRRCTVLKRQSTECYS